MKNLLVWALCSIVVLFFACKDAAPANVTGTETAKSETATPPAEFGDPKYGEMFQTNLDAFSKKDIATWISAFSDDARYDWNGGDSLVGKQAIQDYWTKRMNETIESLTFSEHVVLPMKVNTPQSGEQTGNWVLAWYKVDSKYKNGKTMSQWLHTLHHFNADDKIDQQILYIDRAPINEAGAPQ